MPVKLSTKLYTVAVYFFTDDGDWRRHGTWEGVAADPADAKKQAIGELADYRIDGWMAMLTGVRFTARIDHDPA
jgi:hypothetical protein